MAKRYNANLVVTKLGLHCVEREEDELGDYVLYSDYAALERREGMNEYIRAYGPFRVLSRADGDLLIYANWRGDKPGFLDRTELAAEIEALLNKQCGTTPAVGGLNPTGRATYERGTTHDSGGKV